MKHGMNCKKTCKITNNLHLSLEYTLGKFRDYWRGIALLMTSLSVPHLFSYGEDIVQMRKARTGTSFFRLEMPMYAIATHYPDKFNLIYSDNNLGPKHLQCADLIVAHRAGHLHDFAHDVVKVWPKSEKRFLICHDVDDNEFNLPEKHPMKQMWSNK